MFTYDKPQLSDKSVSVMILGLPNTGKTQVFNYLTGEYNIVANYPMTTIDVHASTIHTGNRDYRVIDTPGFHCLYIHSEEELLVRDSIIREKPDIVVQCIDTNRLKQSLYLTADLLDLEIPLVISLNDIGETADRGKIVDKDKLSSVLGVPVVITDTTQGRGEFALKKALDEARTGSQKVRYYTDVEKRITRIEEMLPDATPYKRKAAMLLLQGDTGIGDREFWIPYDETRDYLFKEVEALRSSFHGNINKALNQKKNQWVDSVVDQIVEGEPLGNRKFSDILSRVTRNTYTGIPILLGVIILCYFLVVNVAGAIEGLLSALITDPSVSFLSGLLGNPFLLDFLVGEYGVLTLGLFNAVVTVLPILSVFFLLFGLIEDSGYLPNIAILSRRILSKIGLSGKSIMPLVLGFGCKTMATLTARSVPSRKERFIAIYLIAFAIPCSAQLGLNMAILGDAGVGAFIITIFFLAIVEIIAGAVLNKVLKDEEKTSFIQELPSFRLPDPKAILIKTYYRLVWFLKESILIFVVAAAALFFLDKVGILQVLKVLLSPIIINWLGLPLDMVDALILTMARHEVAAGLILNMSNAGMLNIDQTIIAVVITTMFVPCIANIIAIFKELGAKAGIVMTVSINITSFILAGMLHWILVAVGG